MSGLRRDRSSRLRFQASTRFGAEGFSALVSGAAMIGATVWWESVSEAGSSTTTPSSPSSSRGWGEAPCFLAAPTGTIRMRSDRAFGARSRIWPINSWRVEVDPHTASLGQTSPRAPLRTSSTASCGEVETLLVSFLLRQ